MQDRDGSRTHSASIDPSAQPSPFAEPLLTAALPRLIAGPLLALALPVLPAVAGSWEARLGEPLSRAGFSGPSDTDIAAAALLVEGPRGPSEDWEADAGTCVLRTVFDPIDGVEHAGTGAWLELETSVDHAARRPGGRSAWGASLSDWFHEASFWMVRSGRREGVILASGGTRTPLLPLDVSSTRRYVLVADETGAHLSVDGEPVLSLPLAARRGPGLPRVRIGSGTGSVRASLVSIDHGCSRPIAARIQHAAEGRLSVAVLGHEGFRPALEIEPGSIRVEGREPTPDSAREADLNGDGLLDLVVELPEAPVAAGRVLHVDARTSAGRHLRGWSSVR